jgi:hypothetical protein
MKHPPEGQQTRGQAASAELGENRPAAAPVRARARVRNRIFLRMMFLLFRVPQAPAWKSASGQGRGEGNKKLLAAPICTDAKTTKIDPGKELLCDSPDIWPGLG